MLAKINQFLKRFRLKSQDFHDEWSVLKNREKVDQVVRDSYVRPQIVFKHSTRCMISSRARSEMEKLTEHVKQERHTVYIHLVDVVRHRGISGYLSEISGISHESPQVLLWAQGTVQLYHSHTDIQTAPYFDWMSEHLPLTGASG